MLFRTKDELFSHFLPQLFAITRLANLCQSVQLNSDYSDRPKHFLLILLSCCRLHLIFFYLNPHKKIHLFLVKSPLLPLQLNYDFNLFSVWIYSSFASFFNCSRSFSCVYSWYSSYQEFGLESFEVKIHHHYFRSLFQNLLNSFRFMKCSSRLPLVCCNSQMRRYHLWLSPFRLHKRFSVQSPILPCFLQKIEASQDDRAFELVLNLLVLISRFHLKIWDPTYYLRPSFVSFYNLIFLCMALPIA